MKQWYTTVGVPGGEYAVLANDAQEAHERMNPAADERMNPAADTARQGPDPYVYYIRPAPPDLAEWLDDAPPNVRAKVPGGWLYCYGPEVVPPVFIPVAGAANITVVGGAK